MVGYRPVKPEPPLRPEGKPFVFFLVFMTLVPVFLFSSPNNEITVKRRATSAYFGTITQIAVYDDFSASGASQKWNECWEEIKNLLSGLESNLSTEISGGDINRYNALKTGDSVTVSGDTAAVFRLARELHDITDGAFNPAVCLLTDLWGFSPRFTLPPESRPIMPYDRNGGPQSALPDERYIRAFTNLADFSDCVLGTDPNGNYILTKTAPDEIIDGQSYSQKIDFGGIGKGYAAERVADLLDKYGYKYGLVNIGSSSFRLMGHYTEAGAALSENSAQRETGPAGFWPVNVRSPFDRSQNYLTAYGRNEGISTSGSYDRFYTINGRRFSHIIDGKTGCPAESEIISATIIGRNAAWDDAVTTALCVMSAEEARRFMGEHLENRQVIMILSDGGIISNTTRYSQSQSLPQAIR